MKYLAFSIFCVTSTATDTQNTKHDNCCISTWAGFFLCYPSNASADIIINVGEASLHWS